MKNNNNNPSNEKKCFVIAPIGKSKSDIRKTSNQVFKHIIKPAVEPLGYNPIRADQFSEPGIITSQIIECVVDSELVIADLTEHNPNVFYELAIRHAIKKPYIQIIQKDEQIPFDLSVTRTIQFDLQDLDNVDSVKNELQKNIKNIHKGKKPIDTPISVALDLKAFRVSEKPLEKSFANLLELVNKINNKISNIENKLSPSDYKISVPSSSRIGWFPSILDEKPPENLKKEWDPIRKKYIWVEKDKTIFP